MPLHQTANPADHKQKPKEKNQYVCHDLKATKNNKFVCSVKI